MPRMHQEVRIKKDIDVPRLKGRLCTRKRYSGRYIETAAGNHVTLTNVPCSIADIANAARTTTAEGDGS